MTLRPQDSSGTLLMSLIWLWGIAGCSGPVKETLYPVVGVVKVGERPLATGTVSLRPDRGGGNAIWHNPTGEIDREGRYELFTTGRPGAPPGKYKVVVFATEEVDVPGAHPGMPKSIINTKYNSEQTSPLAYEVVAAPADGTYDLQLSP